jgi:heptosyltransferase-2
VQQPLRDVLTLLHLSRFYVGNDSGITHLAARATRMLAIFGPTDPAQWAPIGARVKVLRAPGGKLDMLSVDRVFEALMESSFAGQESGFEK